jgi:hypothetical protein
MSVSTDPLRIWHFSIEDENGDNHDITPDGRPIILRRGPASRLAQQLADEYETKTGGLVLKVVYESQGKASPDAEPWPREF